MRARHLTVAKSRHLRHRPGNPPDSKAEEWGSERLRKSQPLGQGAFLQVPALLLTMYCWTSDLASLAWLGMVLNALDA